MDRRRSIGTLQSNISIEGHTGVITALIYIAEDDVYLTASEDHTVRFWKSRGSGKYLPTVTSPFDRTATAVEYDSKEKLLFLGFSDGVLMQYKIAEDYRKLNHVGDLPAHRGRVTGLISHVDSECLLSCSSDKTLCLHDPRTNRVRAQYTAPHSLSCLAYDEETQHAFVGTNAGKILLVKCTAQSLKLVHTLDAHAANVNQVIWDKQKRWLYSSGNDERVVAWDIGGKKGEFFELNVHRGAVHSITLVPETEELLSVGADKLLVAWDLTARRVQAGEWKESDSCQLCDTPFFWNVKVRFNTTRQHHCRRCGYAVCQSCIPRKSPYPLAGFETPVMICKKCYPQLNAEDLATTVKIMDGKDSTLIRWVPEAGLLLAAQRTDHSILGLKYPES